MKVKKGTNLQIAEFEAAIVGFIRETGMPPEITRLVLKDILNNTLVDSRIAIAQERQDFLKAQAKGGENKDGCKKA